MGKLKIKTIISLGLILSVVAGSSAYALENTDDKNNGSKSEVVEEIKSGWKLENGKYYFYNNDGSLKKGFYSDPYGDKYYLNSKTGVMETGWKMVNGKYYSFKNNGVMRKGWYNDGYDWYLLDNSTGEMKIGWNYDGYDYYFMNSDGVMQTGFYDDKYGDSYYLDSKTGAMVTGWKKINNQYRYYKDNGVMVKGWSLQSGIWYYLNESNGIMETGLKTIGDKKYKFEDSGVLIVDKWHEGTTSYSNLNGEFITIEAKDTATNINFKIVDYIKTLQNRESIHNKAIALHGGVLSNNCVYFTSELLRRAGVNIPNYIANTRQLEVQLQSRGWKKHTNLNSLKPGDIVYAGYAHAYTFLGWAGDGYAYIVDNQKSEFGSVLHKRKVFEYDPVYDTNKSTHFFRP